MCGLCGIIGRGEPGDAERVRLAKEAMRHRGPDGDHDWSWVDASSGLGRIWRTCDCRSST